MKIGAFVFPTDYSFPIHELAVELEDRGFESMMVCEHTHIPASRKTPWPGGGELPKEYYHTYDPFVGLSFAANATSRILIGTSVCLIAQRDPFNLAKMVASLDSLSKGRFVFGIGGGWNMDEMENHGIKHHSRFKILEETVLALKALWTEEKSEFHGEFIDFDTVYSFPKPSQRPHPPILLGGQTDYTLHRVARFCDGWMPIGPMDIEDGMNRLKRIAKDHGKDITKLPVTVFQMPSLTRDSDKTKNFNESMLRRYQAAGVDRVLLQIPTADRHICLKVLDSYSSLTDLL